MLLEIRFRTINQQILEVGIKDVNGTIWRNDFHRVGVYWKDPFNLEYYVDGKMVRRVSGKNIIDPNDFLMEPDSRKKWI